MSANNSDNDETSSKGEYVLGDAAPDDGVTSADREFDLMEADAVLSVQQLLTEEPQPSSDGEGPARGPPPPPPHHQLRSRDPPVFSSSYTHGSGGLANNLHVYKCAECNYETYNMAALSSHQKTHKLYQCDVCQMKFSHSANMRRHRMRHTGYKPFECQVCHKRFFRKDHMTEHMVTHSKQLQLHCPLCEKTFHRQVYFKAHLQAEHWNVPGDKECRICGHKSASMKGAKLHYTTRHAPPLLGFDLDVDAKPPPSLLQSDSLSITITPSPDSSRGLASSSSGFALNTTQTMTDTLSSFAQQYISSDSNGGGDGGGDHRELLSDAHHRSDGLSPRSLLPPRHSVRNLTSSVSLHRISSSSRSRGGRLSPRSDMDVQPMVIVKVEAPDDLTIDNSSDENGGRDDERLVGDLRGMMQGYGAAGESPRSAFQPPLAPVPISVASHSHSEACSPNSTLDLVRSSGRSSCSPMANSAAVSVAAFATVSSVLNRQVKVGDLSITPVGGALVCVHCGIVFPDQTLYFLHKGVHSENNPWKCNICGELCRDKYDFNTHILSKAHQ